MGLALRAKLGATILVSLTICLILKIPFARTDPYREVFREK
jgi:hypothetical protein